MPLGKAAQGVWGEAYYTYVEPQTPRIIPPSAGPGAKRPFREIPIGLFMQDTEQMLAGKRVLIVDDEPDILELLEEELDMCVLDKASDFETASAKLKTKAYDCAVLDIMGVRGYDLLLIAKERGIPAVMLTAHALSADDFIKSMQAGADCYVPKEKMIDISFCVAGAVMSKKETPQPPKKRPWYKRFKPFFDRRFGSNWNGR